jgi:hypothetical protein
MPKKKPLNKLSIGDNLVVLKTLPDNSVDAIYDLPKQKANHFSGWMNALAVICQIDIIFN